MRTPRIAHLVSLAAFAAVAADAQPVADKPAFVVGDSWEFTQKSGDGPTTTWTRQVVEIPAADRLRVRLQDNTVADYDGAFNFMPQGNPEFSRILVKYPLKVGDEWAVGRKFANPGTAETGKAKVVAYEAVTVPAGTFQCYRIEAEASQASREAKENRTWKRWYCPEVKWFAKEVLETQTFGTRGRIGGTVSQTSELVKFTPGK
jgi:hypothetical protein